MRKILCVSAVAVSTLFGAIPAVHAQFKVTPEVGIALLKDGDDRATVSPRLGMSVDYFFNKQANGWAVTSGLYYYWKRESYSIAQGFVTGKDGKENRNLLNRLSCEWQRGARGSRGMERSGVGLDNS